MWNSKNALIITCALPCFSWVGVFIGGTYQSFMGALTCVILFYLIWVQILKANNFSKLFVNPETNAIYYTPIVIRAFLSIITDLFGAFVLGAMSTLVFVHLGNDLATDDKNVLDFHSSFMGGFTRTLLMGIYIHLQYFLIAFICHVFRRVSKQEAKNPLLGSSTE
jgi:hypothetical protein